MEVRQGAVKAENNPTLAAERTRRVGTAPGVMLAQLSSSSVTCR